jgi:hypothetical protein
VNMAIEMPERFASDAYDPEMTKLMGDALERAWSDFQPRPRNARLGRSLMATAIIEAVEGGETDRDALMRAATVGLMTAIKADPNALNATE